MMNNIKMEKIQDHPKMAMISWIALIGIVLLMLSACNKNLLNTTPQTSISDVNAFGTPAKILAQVNSLYSELENGSFYGGRYIIFNEQRGEEFSQNDPNAATGAAVWGQNVAPSTDVVNNLWSAAYSTINSANILISNLGSTAVIPDTLGKEYIAEAKFVRALCYLSLVQTYARPFAAGGTNLGVPLRLTAVTSSGSNNLVRSPVADVYAQIIQDLNDAETDLPDGYSSPALNISRAHKSSAIALKTRVYLIEADYGHVLSEASKIISASPPFQYTAGSVTHKLEPNIATVFEGSYTGPEAVFSLPFANSTTETPASQSSLAYTYLGEPILSLNPAGIDANPALSDTADARSGLITTNGVGQRLLTKFSRITAPFSDYIPVIRYAEVLLNAAEARAATGDLAGALSLLSAVRNRSDAGYSFPSQSVSTQDSLIQTILTERRIELLGEGFRTPDLQRWLQTLPAKSGAAGVAPAVDPAASNYIWPIPSNEVATNTLIVQNP